MRIKVFTGKSIFEMEEEINKWLEQSGITHIIHMTQSESVSEEHGYLINISIAYNL